MIAEGSSFDNFGNILCAIIDLNNNTNTRISSFHNVSNRNLKVIAKESAEFNMSAQKKVAADFKMICYM